MDSLHVVVLSTFAVAAVCIIASTFTTVGELRNIVVEDARTHSNQHPDNNANWREFASVAISHIEALPHDVHQAANTNTLPRNEQEKASQEVVAAVEPGPLNTPAGTCYVSPHTDYYGEAVKQGPHNLQSSAAACCQACLDFKPASAADSPCNVWVWCGDRERCGPNFRHCWLKHLPWVFATRPRTGADVPWTSGLLREPPYSHDTSPAEQGGAAKRFHTVTSASGTITHWQMRIHYYWFKKQQAKCREVYGERCQMGGFTRLLHSGVNDELAAEMPTFVANPLPDHSGGYIVLNRPYAFYQWVQKATIPEQYILMSEPDHIFLRPLPNLMVGDNPAAFPFFYIDPSRKDFVHITQKFIGYDKTRRDCERIAPIGSSPTFMRFDDLAKVVEPWMNTSIAIFKDPESNKEWGWVMEMYAFTISLYNLGIGPTSLHLELASQPPWDTTMDLEGTPYYILHYTYGMDYTLDGVFTPGKFGAWRFDKRSYATKPPPRHLSEPPAGMENDLVRFLINAFNEATDAIPGWDEYERSGHASQIMKYDP